jgi:hypothetical protein
MMSARSASFSEARLLGRKGLDRRLAKGNANSENSHPPGPIQSEACSLLKEVAGKGGGAQLDYLRVDGHMVNHQKLPSKN